MVKIVGTILTLALAVIAWRRVVQAKRGAQPPQLMDNEDLQAAAKKAKTKAKQTLEKAKENVEGAGDVVKEKVREKSDR